MQQVRVYQSVLRKPQLAKCFALRQSTENKAGRETYLCFHPFNYNSPTPPGPGTVLGWGCGKHQAGCFSGGPSPLLELDRDLSRGAEAPMGCARSLSEHGPHQLRRTAPRQAGIKGTASSCLGQPPQKGSRPRLFSRVFPAPHFGLQGGVSPPASILSGSCS